MATSWAPQDTEQIDNILMQALRAVHVAEKESREYLPTSGTACSDYLATALGAVQAASLWLAELRQEEKADARISHKLPKPPKLEKAPIECGVCGDEIKPDDVSICGGCDHSICPGCMRDEVCADCAPDVTESF